MKDRIQAFLQSENKSYAQFAEEIGVQPSGISHILSGRNNPSLDFVTKMLHRYPALSAEWLLFGRGSMYKFVSQPTLFDVEMPNSSYNATEEPGASDSLADGPEFPERAEKGAGFEKSLPENDHRTAKQLIRIVMFYSDKTFTEYTQS